jgi:ABC-type glutathione transport system ATPase component
MMMNETRAVDEIQPPLPSFMRGDGILHVDHLSVNISQTDAFGAISAGKIVLQGVTFTVLQNEIFAIAGESGSGKSTLACALMKLLPPRVYGIDGRVLFGGDDLLLMSEEQRREVLRTDIRYLFQEPGQSLNPIARIETQMRHAFIQNESNRDQFHSLLTVFGLTDHRRLMRSYPHELSIGTLQRILLAAALAPRPALLVADEPTSAIDYVLKHAMLEHLRLLCSREGMAVVFITHDMPLVRRYAHRLSILSGARLIESA